MRFRFAPTSGEPLRERDPERERDLDRERERERLEARDDALEPLEEREELLERERLRDFERLRDRDPDLLLVTKWIVLGIWLTCHKRNNLPTAPRSASGTTTRL